MARKRAALTQTQRNFLSRQHKSGKKHTDVSVNRTQRLNVVVHIQNLDFPLQMVFGTIHVTDSTILVHFSSMYIQVRLAEVVDKTLFAT